MRVLYFLLYVLWTGRIRQVTLNLWERQKWLKLVSGIIIILIKLIVCTQRLLNLHRQHKLHCHRLSIFHLELGLYFVDAEFAGLLRLLREINDTEAVIGPIQVEPSNLNLHFFSICHKL